MLMLGVGLAVFAIWFQWRQTRRCLAFYGAPAARAIAAAPRVEMWDSPILGADGRPTAVHRLDVSRTAGLVHLRRGLVEDANFDWSATRDPVPAEPRTGWDRGLAFYADASGNDPHALLFFSFEASGGRMEARGRPGSVGLGRMGPGLRTWLDQASAAGALGDGPAPSPTGSARP